MICGFLYFHSFPLHGRVKTSQDSSSGHSILIENLKRQEINCLELYQSFLPPKSPPNKTEKLTKFAFRTAPTAFLQLFVLGDENNGEGSKEFWDPNIMLPSGPRVS
jgi:hypothetical protein